MADATEGVEEWLGRVLDGRYRIESLLGAGGLGLVFRASHLGLDRAVAVKVLHRDLLHDESLRRRFDREVQMLSRLAHPHIVTLTDSGVLEEGVGYLVMELLEGVSLEQLLDQEGALMPAEAIDVCRQVLLGLAEAHDEGILHRDIKPANVFLQPLAEGRHVKLLDFGLAKVRKDLEGASQSYPTLTASGILVGTPTYIAPERVGGGEPGPASDLYSLGVVFFETLTGRPPFEDEDRARLIRAHLAEPVPALDEVAPELRPTPELRALVLRALAKDPAARFESAHDMLRAIDELPAPAATVEGIDPELGSRQRRSVSGTGATVELGSAELAKAELAVEDSSIVEKGVPPALPSEPSLTVEAAPASEEEEAEEEEAGEGEPDAAPKETGRSTRRSIVLAVTIVLSCLGVFAAWQEFARTTTTARPASAADAGAPLPEDGALDEPAPNPFRSGTLPRELRDARRRILRGRRLTPAQVRAVERYGRAHEADPRPMLLLARHARLRGEWSPMVERYVAAHEADEGARGFPQMLGDLLRATREESTHAAAADAIVGIFGRAAVAEIDEELRGELPQAERARLEDLRRRLER